MGFIPPSPNLPPPPFPLSLCVSVSLSPCLSDGQPTSHSAFRSLPCNMPGARAGAIAAPREWALGTDGTCCSSSCFCHE